MKKLSLVVLLGLALSAVVTGCNNSDSRRRLRRRRMLLRRRRRARTLRNSFPVFWISRPDDGLSGSFFVVGRARRFVNGSCGRHFGERAKSRLQVGAPIRVTAGLDFQGREVHCAHERHRSTSDCCFVFRDGLQSFRQFVPVVFHQRGRQRHQGGQRALHRRDGQGGAKRRRHRGRGVLETGRLINFRSTRAVTRKTSTSWCRKNIFRKCRTLRTG